MIRVSYMYADGRPLGRLTALVIACLLGFWHAPDAFAQISVTQPAAGTTTVSAASDYATHTFQDPMDLSQWSDLGWWQYSLDLPPTNLSGLTFSGGVVSATTTSVQPRFVLVETGQLPCCVAPVGRNGNVQPIDATFYTVVALRMRLPQAAGSMFEYWSRDIYSSPLTPSRFFQGYGPLADSSVPGSNGWHIYIVNMPALGVQGAGAGGVWGSDPGTIGTLHLDPTDAVGANVSLDWVRIVNDDSTLKRTIQWVGSSGNVDIFLDTDRSYANGTLGTIARNVPGSSYSFYVGALPPGDYYVGVRSSGSTAAPSYSPGLYRVTSIPTLTFTAPSEEGSSDDFATTHLNDPWDMNALSDVDYYRYIDSLGLTQLQAYSVAGTSLGLLPVLSGLSEPGAADVNHIGDPHVYLLWSTQRGRTHRIDTDRYRILTVEMGVLHRSRDINGGSIARIVWKRADEALENVSEDIELYHLPGEPVLQKLSLDMATLPLDSAFTPAHSGWTGLVDNFRVDFHEFTPATGFFLKRVKLASLEYTDAAYTIRWNYADPGPSAGSPTLSLYYDTDRDASNGTAGTIALNLNPAAGRYTWNTSALPRGAQYYIHAVYSNGGTANGTYTKWPIVVGNGFSERPRMVVGRRQLTFGAVNNDARTGSATTGGQEVLMSAAGGGSFTWSAAVTDPVNCSFLRLSPVTGTSGSVMTVSITSQPYVELAQLRCTIMVTSEGASNSPQAIDVTVYTYPPRRTAPPRGLIDQPVDGASSVQGAIGVTGWAVDDIGLRLAPPAPNDPCGGGINLWRDPVAGETPDPNTGLICIGSAMFVEDSRPDVDAAFPGYPAGFMAGWGMQILTNALPNGGNGTFRLHVFAIDIDGHRVHIGSRTIHCTNNFSTRPFGTLDTPGQGGVASGSAFRNHGWALAPLGAEIPRDGSTMWVFVDGVSLGHPRYNLLRSDIQAIFPGYANSNGAGGYFDIDTTSLDPTVLHSIAWSVTDTLGRTEGIGSRFFRVRQDAGQSVSAQPGLFAPASTPPGRDLGRPAGFLADLALAATPVDARNGYDPLARFEKVDAATAGYVPVRVHTLDRVELRVGPGATDQHYEGYLVANGELRPLPVGSHLDPRTGTFAWHTHAAAHGAYDLLFVRNSGTARERIPVKITVEPRPTLGGEYWLTAGLIGRYADARP